jgi:two-component system, cell cycle response regulator CtrA
MRRYCGIILRGVLAWGRLMNILLIEDDPGIAHIIEKFLSLSDLKVITARLGQTGIDLTKVQNFDLVILDLSLPDMDGFDVLRILRENGNNVPVIVLTGQGAPENKVLGFGIGADDYVTKPFLRQELLARVLSIGRRSRKLTESIIVTGPIAVNLTQRKVHVDGQLVSLTLMEYHVIELLSLKRGTTVKKSAFMNYLYNGMDEPNLKIIDVYVSKVRRKLSDATDSIIPIETVWGVGYVLRIPSSDF